MLEPDPKPDTCARCAELDQIIEEFVEPKFLADRLYRLVQHGLSQCIAAHGPVTREYLPSATKRITQNLRNSLRELLKNSETNGHS
jgi:hypothetical protein